MTSRLRGILLAYPRANQAAFLSFVSLLAYPIGMVTSAVLARILGPDDYGIFFFFFSIAVFTVSFFRFGISDTSGYLVAQHSDVARQRRMIGATCVAYAGIGCGFSLVIFGLGFVVDAIYGTAINPVLRAYSLLVIAMPLELLVPALTRGLGNIRILGYYRLAPRLLFLGAIIIALAYNRVSVYQLIALQLLSTLVSSVAVMWILRPSFRRLRKNLRQLAAKTREYGFPLYLGQVFDGATNHLDKLMIPFFFNAKELGYYTLATLMATSIFVVPVSICTTIFRDLVRSERLPARVIMVNSAVTIAAFLGFVALAYPAVRLILGEEFLPVARLCWPLAFACLFQGLYQPHAMFLEGKGKGTWISKNFFLQGAVRVAFDAALIPFLGPFGAALAVAVSRLVQLARYYVLVRRYESGARSVAVGPA